MPLVLKGQWGFPEVSAFWREAEWVVSPSPMAVAVREPSWCLHILENIFHWHGLKFRDNVPSRCPTGPSTLREKEGRVGDRGAWGTPHLSSTE